MYFYESRIETKLSLIFSYHNILNVLLHQVILCSNQDWAPKGVQVCVVELVWHTINLVRCIHMNVSVNIRQDRTR